MMNIGILDLQGDVEEHQIMTENALNDLNMEGSTICVNTLNDIKNCDGLIISGGESSTIGMHLVKTGIMEYIQKSGIPLLGTCAGMVLLSKTTNLNQPLLGLIDMNVKRNGFGRQRQSFESEITLFDGTKHQGVFIRAPYVDKVSNDVEILSKYDDKIIAIRQNQYIATSFHPELTTDTVIHKIFLKEVKKCVELQE